MPLRKLTQLTERLNLDTYIQRYKVVAVLNTLFGLIWVVHVMAAWQQEPAWAECISVLAFALERGLRLVSLRHLARGCTGDLVGSPTGGHQRGC